MKKILLPTLLVTTAIPAISMVGCGDPDTPEPPEPNIKIYNVQYWHNDFPASLYIHNFKIFFKI